MSLSDCPKCWDTPCTCGWEYKDRALAYRKALAAVVLGITPKELDILKIPKIHPDAKKDK
jgi:hypothetical protein